MSKLRQQIFGIEDSNDIIDTLTIYRNSGMTGFADGGDNLVEMV